MKIKRHVVSFAHSLKPSHWLAAAKRKAMRLEVVAISLLLLPVILVMADHLPFIDVPSGAFYHDAVSAVFGARITTGTSPTTFSPEDPVTRGQMAVFLHRGLGRVAYDHGGELILLENDREMASVTVNTGGAIGGAGFLKVDATLTAVSHDKCEYLSPISCEYPADTKFEDAAHLSDYDCANECQCDVVWFSHLDHCCSQGYWSGSH